MEELNVYSPIVPVNAKDIGVCYYCGCEAEFSDHAPPQRYVSYYLTTGENCTFAVVSCCKECLDFLSTCREGLIEERKIHVNTRVERKYRKAINIFERWDESELREVSRQFEQSIRAGMVLGEEAYTRLKYPGFEYEIDGTVFHARRQNLIIYSVFGEEFDNYRNALQYAARSYKININVLKEWLMEHDTVFDDAINAYYEFQDKERIRKKKKKLCTEFSKKYRQNPSFISGALDAYEQSNPALTSEQCLELIYMERICKSSESSDRR